jgi:hypothetical protein
MCRRLRGGDSNLLIAECRSRKTPYDLLPAAPKIMEMDQSVNQRSNIREIRNHQFRE